MSLLLADFRTRFPQFAASSDALVQLVLDEALRRIDPLYFDTLRADDAQGYLTAHLITASSGSLGGGGGAVSSVRAGQAAITYAIPPILSTLDLMATGYGRAYLTLVALDGGPTVLL